RLDELEARCGVTPHLLQLQTLRLQQGVDEVEGVELNALAVNLCEDVANLVDLELPIELDERDLILVRQGPKVLAKGRGILCVQDRLPVLAVVTGLFGRRRHIAPMSLIALHPIRQGPATFANDRQWKDVLGILLSTTRDQLRPAL